MKFSLSLNLIAVTVGGFLAIPLPAQEKKAEEEKKSDPVATKLTWRNGESLPGEMVGATESLLTWKSPLFVDPVDLELSALRSITGEAKAVTPEGSMAFNLRDGSRIYGDLVGIADDMVSVRSPRHGDLKIRRKAVTAIHRLKGGDVLWCGPFGEAGWKYPSSKVQPGWRLQSAPSGGLQSIAWRQRVTLPLELPEKVEIEFRISSSARPEFELVAGADKKSVTLTTWREELVLRRGDHFISIGTLKPIDREVDLRLFWNRKAGSGLVARPSGELLGKWETKAGEEQVAEKEQKQADGAERIAVQIQAQGGVVNQIAAAVFPGLLQAGAQRGTSSKSKSSVADGLVIANRGPDLQIDFLRVREWDGSLPQSETSDPFRVRLETSGRVLEGEIVKADKETLVFREDGNGGKEVKFPAEEIESLYFPVAPADPPADQNRPDELRFADGTWIQGRLLGIEDGAFRLESPASEEPISAAIDDLLEMRIHSVAEKDEGEAVPLAKQDKLVTGKTTIHGKWQPAAGGRLHWRLAGAAKPVVIASEAESEVTRVHPEDGTWPRSPALFHLADGQIAPGELLAISGGKQPSVEFRSEITEANRFVAEDLQAIQFRGPEVIPEGFEDPGWQIVRGGEKLVNRKESMVTLEPGGSWGHPSILVGDEIRFTIQPSGYGTLRLRLFCEGTSAESACTNLLLAHYGNEIYCGLEETPGQLNQRRDIPVPSNKPVKIRVNWDNKQTRIHVNGSLAITVPLGKKAPRSGLGLIFEPANLWGNGERQMKVSEFLLRAAPGVTWVPGVNQEAKERALFLPRFRKDDPPRHMLLAPNGDVLRGTIIAASDDRFGFRSGLEELAIPRDRVAAAIWLKPPEPEKEAADEDDGEKAEDGEGKAEEKEKKADGDEKKDGDAKKEKPAEKSEPELEQEKPAAIEPTHWLLLTSGARLGLQVENFGPEFITGESPVLGTCRIPADHIHLIRSKAPEDSPTTLAFANWQLKRAPEPFPETGGGGDESPLIGNAAPEIDLEVLDGKRFRLSEQRGRIVVLDFWATWCGPCIRAIPEMIEEFSQFDSEKVRFVGLNQAEAPDQIRRFIEQRGWEPFEVALDFETQAGRNYGVEGIPHTVIVDHEGKIAWVSTGFKPNGARDAANKVRELLGKAPDDRTLSLFEAEDIRDLDIKAGRFDEFVAAMLADFVGEDREKALEIFEKAIEIVDTSRERNAWKFKYADQAKSFAGDVVIHLRNQVDPVSWIAFQSDLMRSERVPPFEVLRIWGENAIIDGLVAAKENSDKPGQPIEMSLRILGECAGSEEMLPFIAPMLVKVIQRYDGDTVLHLHSTFEGAETELAPAYLKEIAMATDLALRMREAFRGRFYLPEVTAHYLAALENDSVPLNVRIRLADFLAGGAVPPPNRELVLAGAEAIAEGWSGEAPVFQFWAIRPLQAFMREERDAAWKQTSKALGEGFRKRYLGETSPVGVPNLPDDTLLSLMMDVYVSLGDLESTKTVFERHRKRFVDYEMPIIHLVRAGEVEEAADLLTSQWSRIGRKWTTEAFYDKLLANNAEAFLDQIDRSDLRVFAEALIANAKDPLPTSRAPRVPVPHGGPRSLRLQAAAKKYGEATFSNAVRKRMVLGILANDIAAARIVAEELREEAEEIDLDEALDARTYSTVIREDVFTKPDLAVVQGALLLDMAEGKVEEVNQKLDRIAGAASANAAHKEVFVEKILKMPIQAILGSPEPAKTAEALIPVCRRMALGIEGLDARKAWVGQKWEPWAQLTFALVEAGKIGEFLPWLRETSEGDALAENMQLWNGAAGVFFMLVSEKLRGVSVEERVTYLEQVLDGDWLVEEFTNYTNASFRNLVNQGVLSPSEFLEHGEAIATAAPRNGHAWNDLAYVHSRNGDLDGALAFWDKAVKAMETAGLANDAGRYRVNAARTQYQRLQKEAAFELLAAIDAGTYNGRDLPYLLKQIEAEEFRVAGAEEWEAMAKTALSGKALKPRPAKSSKTATAIETEPDPFGADMKEKPEATGPSGDLQDGEDKGKGPAMDEPDPFAPAAPAPAKQAGDASGKEDPKPAESKPEKKTEGEEPDPFAN